MSAMEEVGYRPPEPLAQITLMEMSTALERIEKADPDLMRAVLRGIVYERDVASARVARALRRGVR
jgi:hypothetical protein